MLRCRASLPRSLATLAALAPLMVLSTSPAAGENWPAWRGPWGTGVTSETDLPLAWSRTQGVKWRVALPEPGNSTPIVWDDRVLLTQPITGDNLRTLVCLDREDGKQLWRAEVVHADKEPTHPTNPYCSASPATDGQRVVAWFGAAGLHAYDLDGGKLWQRDDLEAPTHEWGYGASPILSGELCIVAVGPGPDEFVIAVDKHSGQTVWKWGVPAPEVDGAPEEVGEVGPPEADAQQRERARTLRGSWSTPLVIRVPERDELIVLTPLRVSGLEPRSGRLLWTCRGLGPLVYASPIWGDQVLVALGGYHSASLAVRPGGSGDVTANRRLWHQPRSPLRLGTGIIHEGHLYLHDMRGIAQCLDLASGEEVWARRLAGGGDRSGSWSSMILSGDRIYVLNQSADTFVFRAAPQFKQLAVNSLGEPTNSSLAVSRGELFIRTHEGLWCIAASATDLPADAATTR